MTALIRMVRGLTDRIAMATLMLMALVTFVDVAGRVLFNEPLGFAYEMIGVLLGLATYAGLYATQLHRGHIAIDLLEDRYRRWPRFDTVRGALVWLVEALFWGLVAAWITRQAGTSMAYGETFLFLPVPKHVPLYAIAVLAWVALAGHLARGWLSLTGRDITPPAGAGKAEQVG